MIEKLRWQGSIDLLVRGLFFHHWITRLDSWQPDTYFKSKIHENRGFGNLAFWPFQRILGDKILRGTVTPYTHMFTAPSHALVRCVRTYAYRSLDCTWCLALLSCLLTPTAACGGFCSRQGSIGLLGQPSLPCLPWLSQFLRKNVTSLCSHLEWLAASKGSFLWG